MEVVCVPYYRLSDRPFRNHLTSLFDTFYISSQIPIYCSFQAHLRRLSSCRFRHCGEGISKGNLVPLGPPVGVRDPLRRGPGFLLLFSIKSKDGTPCFAVKVLNGRMTNVVQPPLSLYLDYSTKPAPHFLRLSYNSPSPFGCKIPLGLL